VAPARPQLSADPLGGGIWDRRSVIQVESPEGRRFDVALDFLEEGRAVRLLGLRLALEGGALEVEVPTTQNPRSLTIERTDREYEEARGILKHVAAQSPRFQELLNRWPISLILVVDYGDGAFQVSRIDRDTTFKR
jgi:hypothetical protein